MDRRPADPIDPATVTVLNDGEIEADGDPCPAAPPRLRAQFASWLHTVRIVGLCLLLMFTILAYGAVESWSLFLLQAGAATLFVLWAIEQVLRDTIEISPNPFYLPLLGFGIWISIQLALRIPAYRYPAANGLLACIGYALLFFVAVQCCRSRQDLLIITRLLGTFGFFLAVFAMLQGFTAPGKLYWVRTPSEGGWVYGPYVDHSHYAGLMEMLAPLGLVLGLSSRLRSGQKVLCLFAGAVMAASIFLSQSRGGIVAFVLELIFLAVALFAERRGKHSLVGLAAFLVFVIASGVWLSGGSLLRRMENMQDTTRLAIAKDSLRMFAAKPATGWGMGNFEHVFPRYRTFYSNKLVEHAHNDYLEAMTETGLPGGVFVLLFVVLLYRKGLQATATWDRSNRSAVQLAALVGCTGILLHSLTDFNMHIPANAAVFLLLAAMATSPEPEPLAFQDDADRRPWSL
ncbi:MAG: O-antigen ligase family protein [Terriglobales bacterium]